MGLTDSFNRRSMWVIIAEVLRNVIALAVFLLSLWSGFVLFHG